MKFLQSISTNILITIFLSAICFLLFINSGVLENAGMAALFVTWIPLFIGLFTIVSYLVSRLFTKKYNWVVTVIGNLVNIILLVGAFIQNS